jgi:hypothetical protein
MIDVTDDWWLAPLIAAGAGLIGGIAYELIQSRRGGRTGMIEIPGGQAGHLVDLGFIASMLLGAIAAAAFLVVYTPVESTVDNVTREEYSGIGLIAVSLIVGASGSSVLGALTKSFIKGAEDVRINALIAGLEEAQNRLPAGDGGAGDVEVVDAEGTERARETVRAGDLDQLAAQLRLLTAQAKAMRPDA